MNGRKDEVILALWTLEGSQDLERPRGARRVALEAVHNAVEVVSAECWVVGAEHWVEVGGRDALVRDVEAAALRVRWVAHDELRGSEPEQLALCTAAHLASSVVHALRGVRARRSHPPELHCDAD